ncbi:queuosine 5'-phosphate N-glycosylase/hydrolase-like [Polyergus mexicanus]|uniref:queuosine 5'-phosphate N-glycosylase/hydrolase-like n=1 Tax=Polyergus mexicanus TaxID=615972 RepID=UPI0038B646C3
MAEDNSSDVMESLLAAEFIAEKAQDVFVNEESIKSLASHVMVWFKETVQGAEIKDLTDTIANKFLRKYDVYPHKEDPRAADWLFVLHTLNFSLWHPKSSKQWTVDGELGFIALCSAMKRTVDKGMRIWVPSCYSRITQSEFEYMFQGDDSETTIPLIQERLKILHEVGEILLNKFKGTFTECIRLSEHNADKLVKLLFDEFELYRDEAVYEGKKVRFCNKARALVNDIWSYYKKCEPKFELDKKNLMSTMFINYRAPEVLFHYKILRYSDKLVTRFKNKEPLEHGSREELEIRGCSFFAAKKISEEVWKLSRDYIEDIPILKTDYFMVPVLVDNYLFVSLIEILHKENEDQEPFHYIRTMLHYVIWDNKNLPEVVRCLMGYRHYISSYRSNGRAVDWLFMLDTLKFSFWTPKATKQWTINEPIEEFAIILTYPYPYKDSNTSNFIAHKVNANWLFLMNIIPVV